MSYQIEFVVDFGPFLETVPGVMLPSPHVMIAWKSDGLLLVIEVVNEPMTVEIGRPAVAETNWPTGDRTGGGTATVAIADAGKGVTPWVSRTVTVVMKLPALA